MLGITLSLDAQTFYKLNIYSLIFLQKKRSTKEKGEREKERFQEIRE